MKHSDQLDADPSMDTLDNALALSAPARYWWTAIAGVAVGVLALILALLLWVYPPSRTDTSGSYSDQQTKDAKASVCAAFTTVRRAVARNTHLQDPPDGGAIGALAVATSARLALYGGGSYLLDHTAAQPAASADLRKAINSVAGTLEDLGVNYLAGAAAVSQDQLRQQLEGQLSAADQLCK